MSTFNKFIYIAMAITISVTCLAKNVDTAISNNIVIVKNVAAIPRASCKLQIVYIKNDVESVIRPGKEKMTIALNLYFGKLKQAYSFTYETIDSQTLCGFDYKNVSGLDAAAFFTMPEIKED
jgi:hypothetical protein